MDKDTLYYNSYYDRENDVYLLFLYNTKTGKQSVHKMKKPKTDIYMLKPSEPTPTFYKETISVDKLNKFKVSYKYRQFAVAELLGRKDSYIRAVKAKALKANHIFLDRRCFGSDLPIEDTTIMDYLDSLGYDIKEDGTKEYYDVPPIDNLTRGYYDIETDVMHTNVREDQPITCSTYYDDKSETFEVFAHIRNDFNGLAEIMEDEVSFKNEVKELMREVINNSTASKKTKELLFPIFLDIVDNCKINLNWYKTEADMTRSAWKTMIRDYHPMFLGIYNAAYDIHQTELRADKLGIPQHQLFCHPEVGKTFNFNYRNTNPKAAKRRHNYDCASYTKIIDTQITYFALRPQDNLEQESLDAVSKHELGFGKLSYKHITDFIGRLPYLDYRTYLKYNIIDVFVMALLDKKTDDINSLITRRFIVRTEYPRVFSPMTTVTNTFFHLCRRMGYIMCNDVNKLIMTQNVDEATIIERLREVDDVIESTYDTISNRIKIAGGLCSDPTKFKKKLEPVIEGLVNNKLMKYVMDGDAVSMYPKIIEHTNISKDSLDGRITKIGSSAKMEDIERATQALISKSPAQLGAEFFGLPSIREMIEMAYNRKHNCVTEEERNRIPLKPNPEYIKMVDSIKKLLSQLDKTKTSTSDVDVGIPSTTKYFHIKENESIMKINGSLYKVTFTPNVNFPCESIGQLFGIGYSEGYISSSKGEYFSDMSIYTRPKIHPLAEELYHFKLDESIIEKLENDKLTYTTIHYKDKKIDITDRTHRFLSHDVDVSIRTDDTFVFTYKIQEKYGTFDFEIHTKTLQY